MNNAVSLKNEPTLSLPDLVVPVLQQDSDEANRGGNTMLEEHVIGSKVPLLMLECKFTDDKDHPIPTDKADGVLKPTYVDYNQIIDWDLTFPGLLPSMTFTITNDVDYNCKVGNRVWLCLVPMNKNTGHEKIKMQFTVSTITKDEKQTTYACEYYVDNLFNTYPLYSNDKTSYQIALELCKELQIGFKSNVDAIEDCAWYKSNKSIFDTLSSLSYGVDLTDLFSVYIDEDNCFNLVNMYHIKTNIEDDFQFNMDIDVGDTDNNDFKSYENMQAKFTNLKEVNMLPTYIQRFHKMKLTDGSNTGDNFIYRYIDIDEFGMPTVNNSQLEYEESEGKTILFVLGEQTKEDVEDRYVRKEVLDSMREKIYNKLFADVLEIDTKYVYGLRRYQQVKVEIYQYDGLKKAQGKPDDEVRENEEVDPDLSPVRDEVLSGQYLILEQKIYYRKEKGCLRATYTLFKLA